MPVRAGFSRKCEFVHIGLIIVLLGVGIYISPIISIILAIFTIVSAIFVVATAFENTRPKRLIPWLVVSSITQLFAFGSLISFGIFYVQEEDAHKGFALIIGSSAAWGEQYLNYYYYWSVISNTNNASILLNFVYRSLFLLVDVGI